MGERAFKHGRLQGLLQEKAKLETGKAAGSRGQAGGVKTAARMGSAKARVDIRTSVRVRLYVYAHVTGSQTQACATGAALRRC